MSGTSVDPPVIIQDDGSSAFAQLHLGHPNVTITLTPFNPPIQIPGSGGTFSFNMQIVNQGINQQALHYWSFITRPNQTIWGPILGPASLSLQGGQSWNQNIDQFISSNDPLGTYTYTAYTGRYDAVNPEIWSSDQFTFVKYPNIRGGIACHPFSIPYSGGIISYFLGFLNQETTPFTFNYWAFLNPPIGPSWSLLGPNPVTLNPGEMLFVPPNFPADSFHQYITATDPPGHYVFEVRVGNFPNIIWNSDTCSFNKEGTNFSGDFSFITEPSPFNSSTSLRYALPQAANVTLRVYDTAGRVVATLVNGWRQAGNHDVTFDGSRLSSGLYFVKMEAGEYRAVQKMVLLK
jgi:hypothetical protein